MCPTRTNAQTQRKDRDILFQAFRRKKYHGGYHFAPQSSLFSGPKAPTFCANVSATSNGNTREASA